MLKIISQSWKWQRDYHHIDIPIREMETRKLEGYTEHLY